MQLSLFRSLKSIIPYEPYLVAYARENRKKRTYSERIIWNLLKGKKMRGYDFHRQKPILRYIVDFFCEELMLAIEVDGITHHDDAKASEDRTTAINQLGIEVIRLDAKRVVNNTSEVMQVIEAWIINKEESVQRKK